MHIYIYMYVCMYLYIYKYYIHMHRNSYEYIHLHKHIHKSIYTDAVMFDCICMNIYAVYYDLVLRYKGKHLCNGDIEIPICKRDEP